MKLVAVTPTYGRPEALKLCKLWMERQARQPDEHIIVEGGHLWENLLNVEIPEDADAIAIIEDDDYYAPGWLEIVEKHIPRFSAFGKASGHMYHMDGVAAMRTHPKRASLSTTAVHRALWERIRYIASRGHENIDEPFWWWAAWDNAWVNLDPGLNRGVTPHVSIKGMPSKRHYTKKHRIEKFRAMPCAWRLEDQDHAIFRRWVGDDAFAHYEPFFPKVKA